MAGSELMSLLQGVAEAALVRDLRGRHRMPFHLPHLVERAKHSLAEEGLPVTPMNLRRAAEDVAEREVTMLEDVIGTTRERWDPAARELVEEEVLDPRTSFVR
jgi:hypothetical protein